MRERSTLSMFAGGSGAAPANADVTARASDPPTSHEAAEALAQRRGASSVTARQAAVLHAYTLFGAMDHEQLVATYTTYGPQFDWPSQSFSSIRTRSSELVDLDKVHDTGRRRCTAAAISRAAQSGHEAKPNAIVWAAGPQTNELLRKEHEARRAMKRTIVATKAARHE